MIDLFLLDSKQVKWGPAFLHKLFQTDEATFTSNKKVNLDNNMSIAIHTGGAKECMIRSNFIEGKMITSYIFGNNLNNKDNFPFFMYNLAKLLEDVIIANRVNDST